MRYIGLYSLILLLLFNSKTSAQRHNNVKVIPGVGITFNNDSIFLNKTSIKELHQILKIKDSNPNEFVIEMWDGYNPETNETTNGSNYVRNIKYKSITFEFEDENDKDNLKLKWITLYEHEDLKIYVDNGLVLRMNNPGIKELYPLQGKHDYISDDGLMYNLYKYGISLRLERLENGDLRLIELSTHYKLE